MKHIDATAYRRYEYPMIQYNNIFREIRQAVGLSWTEPRSPPFGFYPYFLLTQATSSITTYALADTSAGAFLWLSPRGDEFWANRGIWPCFEGGFISILPASLCSVDLCIERFCSPVLHRWGFCLLPLWPSEITRCWCSVSAWAVGVHRQICLAGYVGHNFAETFHRAYLYDALGGSIVFTSRS